MKNKGFTLVELIGVIVVLALMLMVGVPSITRMLKNANEQEIERFEMDLVIAAENYVALNPDLLDQLITGDDEIYITIEDLKRVGFVKTTIIDPMDDSEYNDIKDYYIRVYRNSDNIIKYEYVRNSGSLYITIYLDDQEATDKGSTSVDVISGRAIPDITPPIKTNYTFIGYYTGENGSGTKYINADGTSAKTWTETGVTTLYAYWIQNVMAYQTSGPYEFVVPVSGVYKLEVWGAQGGSADSNNRGGYGGYSVGTIALNKDELLYIHVGGQGAAGYPNNDRLGGYNGGGSVFSTNNDANRLVAGGGGATHIALADGELSTLDDVTDKVIIVAGGGGGGFKHDSAGYNGIGGDGGGCDGGDGTYGTSGGGYYGIGGSQTAAGYAYGDSIYGLGGFGYGGDVNTTNPNGSAGGGGWYGGGGTKAGIRNNGNSSGGGGSGYINNSRLVDKAMYCFNCKSSTSASCTHSTVSCAETTPTANCAKVGDGYAKITFISN